MKKSFVDIDKIREIVKSYPTPFHIYDEEGIRKNAESLNKAFAWNKGFKEYFAVKAMPNPFILQILKEEGCGVDCSTKAELVLSKAAGFSGEDIMFSSNETPAGEFAYVDSLGGIINLDDITMIEQLTDEVKPLPEVISCRYNPGGVYKLSNGIMDNPQEAKYGMTKEQLFKSYEKLRELGIKRFGIHAFLASNTLSNEYYPKLAADLFEIVLEIREKLGITLEFVNLSGGVGVNYRPDENANDIMAIGEGVRKVYDEILVKNGIEDLAIYAELGRFMLAPYGNLITRIIHEKHIYKDYMGVDACATDLMRPAMYGSYHHIELLTDDKSRFDEEAVYDIVGGLCENNDKFAIDRKMPKLNVGDYLAILDTGAHGYSMGYNYNGKLKSAELLLKSNKEVQLIRRAEELKDYFATFDIFDFDFK